MILISRRVYFLKLFSVGLLGFTVSHLNAHAQNANKGTPRVTAAAMPLYPVIAVAARVQGTVKIRVTTNGKGVASLERVSGPAMLVKSAEQNIQTWTFDQHKPDTFITTFDYRLEDPPSCTYTNSKVDAKLPLEIHVSIRRLQTCDPTATVTSTRSRRSKKN